MKEIQLTKGFVTQVDDEDYNNLNQYEWYAKKYSKDYYAARNITLSNKKQKTIFMHNIIMNTPENMECDHAFHNTLDNRKFIKINGELKYNLRNCTHGQNQINRVYKSASGYRGVHYLNFLSKFQVSLTVNGKKRQFGLFIDPIKAARQYDKMALKYQGEFAITNF